MSTDTEELPDRITYLTDCLQQALRWDDPRVDVTDFGRIAKNFLSSDPHTERQYHFSIDELTHRGVQGLCKDDQKAARAKAKADQLVSQGNHAEALTRYTTALRYSSDAAHCARLHSNRALCSQRLGTAEAAAQAEEDSTAAISLDTSFCKAYYRRAVARQPQGQMSAALQDAEQGLRLQQNSAEFRELCQQLRAVQASQSSCSNMESDTTAQTATRSAFRAACIPGQGTTLMASRFLDVGELIMEDLPFAALPETHLQDKLCWRCFKRLGVMQFFCAGCAMVRYCSLVCKQQDDCHLAGMCGVPWVKTMPAFGVVSVMMAAKIQQGAEHAAAITRLDPCMTKHKLMSRTGLTRLACSCLMAAFWNARAAEHAGDLGCPQLTVQQILEAQYRLQANGKHLFPANLHTNTSFGAAIYPQASLLNHSCRPNCVASFDNAKLCLRVALPVQAGEALSVSYGPQAGLHATAWRQRTLLDDYGFHCACQECVNGHARDLALCGWLCFKCSAPVLPLHSAQNSTIACEPLPCSKCGSIEGKQALQRRQDKLTKAMDAAGDLNTMILHTREATTPQVVAKDGQYSLAPHASALLPVVMQANKELKQVYQSMLVPTHHFVSSLQVSLYQMQLVMEFPGRAVMHALKRTELAGACMPPESLERSYQHVALTAVLPHCPDGKITSRLQQLIEEGSTMLRLLTGKSDGGMQLSEYHLAYG